MKDNNFKKGIPVSVSLDQTLENENISLKVTKVLGSKIIV